MYILVDLLLLKMTGDGLDGDMNNLKEQNLILEDEVKLLKVEQCSILHRVHVDAIKEVMRNRPVQVDIGVSALPDRKFVYIYSPVNPPAKSMPP